MNLNVTLLDSQREFFEAMASSEDIMLSGAYGSGKTRVGLEIGKFLNVYYPGNSGLIVRKNYSTLASSTLWTLLHSTSPTPVLPREMIYSHNQSKHHIVMRSSDPKRPSHIYYSGIDDPVKLRSFVDLGWVFYDEGIESSENEYIELSGRMRSTAMPFTRWFTATNPGDPGHYLYKKFFESKKPLKNNLNYCIESNTLENYFLPDHYLRRLARFKGKFYKRFVLGQWIPLEGIIYDIWDPMKHIIPKFDIPADWPVFLAIDWGFTNPLVIQWWTVAPSNYEYVKANERGILEKYFIPEGSAIMYREIYKTHLNVVDASQMVLNIMEETGDKKPEWVVCDHDPGDSDLFERETGWYTLNAIKKVMGGIQEVMSKMAVQEHGLEIMPTPRLFFFENARCHEPDEYLEDQKRALCSADEILSYKWKKDRATGLYIKDEPEKKDDHGMDSMRYFLMEYSHGGNIVVRISR